MVSFYTTSQAVNFAAAVCIPPIGQKTKYPICLEGERACPPEDVGGFMGYYEYLEALADPGHEQHAELLEWRGRFDPEDFDAEAVTKSMRTTNY